MIRRKFTAEFKAKLVLELLTGETEIGKLAYQHQINPNQLRAWKTQFLAKAATLFEDDKTAKEAAEQEQAIEETQAAMLKTIGQLTLERDYLMKQAHERNKGVFLRRG